jgi:hypothetical protein
MSNSMKVMRVVRGISQSLCIVLFLSISTDYRVPERANG